MKKVLLLIAAALLMACHNDVVVVDFDCERVSPLMYSFTNNSLGCDEYKWDFGDGMWAYGTNATHEYEKSGTYIVTLTAIANGEKYDKRVKINVTEPVIYFAGYTLYSIPYEDRYYKVVFKDDNLFPSAWDFQTVYTPILDNTDIPYTAMWKQPQVLEDINSHTYYTIQVIRTTNASNDNNDVSCTKQKLYTKDIKRYLPEYVLQTETGSTTIGIHMEYRY
jgi:PKD repeat protein